MPANGIEDSEIWAIITYLRSLSPVPQTIQKGNVSKGEAMFRGSAGCATCHMVNGKGGLLGPDLSRVGASRSRQYLVESIRTPDTELSDGMSDPNNHYVSPLIYDTVTITLQNGEKITGVAKDEDTFSIQLMDTSQTLRLYEKSELKSVQHEKKSLMPAYDGATIPPAALDDLLAYLESLRGM